MLLFWIPKDHPWFSFLACFDPVLSSGKDAWISLVSLHLALPLPLFSFAPVCHFLNVFFHNSCFFFFLNYMRTEWSLRGKGNCCSCLQPRNSKSCKFSCTASTQTNWMHSPRPWQGKSLKETLPGCSSSPIAAVICAVCFLAMRAARKVLVFSCCFVFLRARFSCGQDFALLHWWVWGSPL